MFFSSSTIRTDAGMVASWGFRPQWSVCRTQICFDDMTRMAVQRALRGPRQRGGSMRGLGAWLCCSVALVLLTGCPPTYPKCTSDDSCKDHAEVCVQGQCQECAENGNCKS